MVTENWRAKAEQIWGERAVWISGDGQFALVAPCGTLSVSLSSTREEAEDSKRSIDESGCGGQCHRSGHQIFDLSEPVEYTDPDDFSNWSP